MQNHNLFYQNKSSRNITDIFLTSISFLFALFAILPLILVVSYILFKGGSQISLDLFTLEPNPPGDEFSAGGINPALVGTLIITSIASLIAIPIGVGGGIYLAEYSKGGLFARFIRFGVNVLAGVPSIIAGVFIYALIVSTKILFGSTYSGLAGGIALSILMLPSVIKTTDEGLKLVPNELRQASLGIGASMYTTILRITLPAAFRSIATGVVLGIARAAGETAPLIFTALFSYYYVSGFEDLFYEMGSLSVLIYNFALEPYDVQNKLAWAASFILVLSILLVNIFARILANITTKEKRI